jgi:hypothetical protein
VSLLFARATMMVMVVGLVAAACSSDGTVGQQARAWADSTGWPSTVRQLQGDLRRLSGLGQDTAGVRRTVCDVLVTDALAANQQLPTPDRALTGFLSDAYTSAAAAGRDCFNGSVPVETATARAAGAAADLVRAQARYDSLTSTLPGAS